MLTKTLLFIAAAVCAAATHASAQMLLAGYDFTNGTAAAASPNAPSSYLSAFGTQAGTAALYLDGTHGSSTFVTAAAGNEVTGFAGTTVNAGTGFSTSTTSPSALGLQGGAAVTGGTFTANGKIAVFTLSMTGYTNLMLSFATQRTSTGFTGNTFSYSLNGTTFTPVSGVSVVPAAAFATVNVDFSGITALNNAATVYIAYTLAGATNSAGNNRLDNIQFNATATTAVPEPSAYAAMALGSLSLVLMLRYRRIV